MPGRFCRVGSDRVGWCELGVRLFFVGKTVHNSSTQASPMRRIFRKQRLNIRTCYTQDGPVGPTLFSLFAGQQLNILGSQHVDLYWRQGVLYIESAEQSRTAEHF